MAYEYQFSVGTMVIRPENAATPEVGVGVMTEVTVSYDGDPQSFYGGDYRLPLAVELGNRSGEISVTSARFDTADTILDNRYVNVVLGTGNTGGGLTGTINNCKIGDYNVSSTQNDFVTSDMRLLITSQNAEQSVRGGTWPAWV